MGACFLEGGLDVQATIPSESEWRGPAHRKPDHLQLTAPDGLRLLQFPVRGDRPRSLTIWLHRIPSFLLVHLLKKTVGSPLKSYGFLFLSKAEVLGEAVGDDERTRRTIDCRASSPLA